MPLKVYEGRYIDVLNSDSVIASVADVVDARAQGRFRSVPLYTSDVGIYDSDSIEYSVSNVNKISNVHMLPTRQGALNVEGVMNADEFGERVHFCNEYREDDIDGVLSGILLDGLNHDLKKLYARTMGLPDGSVLRFDKPRYKGLLARPVIAHNCAQSHFRLGSVKDKKAKIAIWE